MKLTLDLYIPDGARRTVRVSAYSCRKCARDWARSETLDPDASRDPMPDHCPECYDLRAPDQIWRTPYDARALMLEALRTILDKVEAECPDLESRGGMVLRELKTGLVLGSASLSTDDKRKEP